MTSKTQRKGQRGFTLVELLLVLVILAMLGALILPRIFGIGEGAKVKATALQISRISMAVENFYLDTGSTPDSLEQLVNDAGNTNGWNGPYIKKSLLQDPWRRNYQFRNPGQNGDFDIYSYGADGQQGGEKFNADITNWE